MKEYNRETLLAGIRELPRYNPPDHLWEVISHRLDTETVYQQALAGLPLYQAPDQVWTAIEKELDQEPAIRPGRKIRYFHPMRIAAAVALLVLAGWLVLGRINAPGYTLAYGEETIYPVQSGGDMDDQELIRTLLWEAERSAVHTNPEFQALRSELDELDAARVEIEQMMKRYGKEDQALAVQLSDIEKHRTTVVKRMAVMI